MCFVDLLKSRPHWRRSRSRLFVAVDILLMLAKKVDDDRKSLPAASDRSTPCWRFFCHQHVVGDKNSIGLRRHCGRAIRIVSCVAFVASWNWLLFVLLLLVVVDLPLRECFETVGWRQEARPACRKLLLQPPKDCRKVTSD